MAATMVPSPPGRAATAPGVAVAATVGTGAPRANIAMLATQVAGGAAELSTIDMPHAATLAGPHIVADLPALPRIDDSLYAIGAEIARGGMGRILSARDRRLRRDVVIKVTRRESGRVDPRFEREALITARLQHPSIVRVYDAGVLGDGTAFYAMERVRGRSLEVVIGEAQTLAARLALLPHAIAVCDALAYAHSEGVVHRDLKPANVLIGPFGETVVIDWGLAKDVRAAESSVDPDDEQAEPAGDSSLTHAGAVLGTPSFMAPEQARGEPSDERSDIYALGALLYNMLTGVPPIRGATTTEVLDAVAAGKHAPISEREPHLPEELASLVEKAMAHDPTRRFASAKDLADELRRFSAGKLLASHTYSLARLVKRWLWRHRVTVGVAAFALVVLVLVGVLAVKNVLRERDLAQQAREEAENEREIAGRRYDDLVIDQAGAVLDLDPSRTAAWLQQLNMPAYDWPKTYDLAVEATRRGLAKELRGHTQDVELVAVTPDGTHVVTGSDDSTLRYWDLATKQSIVLEGHKGPIEQIAVSPDGKYVASGGTDHDVWLWELATGIGRPLRGHGNTVRGLAFSPDGTQLASVGEDGSLYIWDVASATGKQIAKHTAGFRPVAWLDNDNVIVGGFDGQIGRFDVKTGKGAIKPAHAAELRCFALSPDHKYFVAGDEDGLATLWTWDGERVKTLGRHTDVVRKVLFTHDGKHVISAGGDELVHVFSIPDGPTVELRGNESGVKDIAISDDDTEVASAGIDGVVRVWNLTGSLVREFRGHGFAVKAVAFTPDHRLVSGAEDDRARVWHLDPTDMPPRGAALKTWLAAHTNVEVRPPRAPR
ncbi:MAG: protein kinase, partial [Kofleriaceae bacterium]|nr:protein kinase [Kofleriaceae bacterium]